MTEPRHERLWSNLRKNVVIGDGCWGWKASVDGKGYGQVFVSQEKDGIKKCYKVFRLLYELLRGPVPPGLVLDHLCRNPGCVNPEHVEAVTQRENILRGTGPSAANARKTHCKYGHEFTPENTMITRKRGKTNDHRGCRICDKVRWKRRNANKGERRRLARLGARSEKGKK